MYEGKEKEIIFTIAERKDMPRLKDEIKEIDRMLLFLLCMRARIRLVRESDKLIINNLKLKIKWRGINCKPILIFDFQLSIFNYFLSLPNFKLTYRKK